MLSLLLLAGYTTTLDLIGNGMLALLSHPQQLAAVRADPAVLIALAAADRDPVRFRDPDRFDVNRRDAGGVAFGYGIHRCLGAPLARLEGELAIGTLLRRLPDLALADDPAKLGWRRSPHLRGLHALPVRFAAAG